MIRLIIIVVIGLIAGIGGGTGLAVVRARKAWTADSSSRGVALDSLGMPIDSVSRDSTHHGAPDSSKTAATAHAVGGDSAHTSVASATDSTPKGAAHDPRHATTPRSAAPDSGHAPAAKAADVTATKPLLPPKPLALPRPVPAASATVPAGEPPTAMPARKIARIFAAMAPKEASRVLEQLDDADVRTILASLSEKQAASILSNFPPPRAAAISKAAMRAARSTP